METEFAAYFDDGGHPSDQDHVTVAGFLSAKDQWLRAVSEWQDSLEECGLPRDTVFHMTDFISGKDTDSPFYGWSEGQKHRLRDKLVHVLAVRMRRQFSETVFMEDYRQLNEEYALEECYGAPYGIAGRNLNMRLQQWLKAQPPDTQLLIFFEDGTKHKGDLIDACRRDGLPCPVFADKKKLVPLQMADLLAWEVAKTIRQVRKEPNMKLDYYFDVLTRRGNLQEDHTAYTTSSLELVCKGTVPGFKPVPPRSLIGDNYHIAFEKLKKKSRRRTVY